MVVTTMWNLIPRRRMEDANRRFGALENEIYVVGGLHCSHENLVYHFQESPKLGIKVTRFENSSDSALSIMDKPCGGWMDKQIPWKMNHQCESYFRKNLRNRINNTLEQFHFLSKSKQEATTPGNEDPALLGVVLRDENVELAALQSFWMICMRLILKVALHNFLIQLLLHHQPRLHHPPRLHHRLRLHYQLRHHHFPYRPHPKRKSG